MPCVNTVFSKEKVNFTNKDGNKKVSMINNMETLKSIKTINLMREIATRAEQKVYTN